MNHASHIVHDLKLFALLVLALIVVLAALYIADQVHPFFSQLAANFYHFLLRQ